MAPSPLGSTSAGKLQAERRGDAGAAGRGQSGSDGSSSSCPIPSRCAPSGQRDCRGQHRQPSGTRQRVTSAPPRPPAAPPPRAPRRPSPCPRPEATTLRRAGRRVRLVHPASAGPDGGRRPVGAASLSPCGRGGRGTLPSQPCPRRAETPSCRGGITAAALAGTAGPERRAPPRPVTLPGGAGEEGARESPPPRGGGPRGGWRRQGQPLAAPPARGPVPIATRLNRARPAVTSIPSALNLCYNIYPVQKGSFKWYLPPKKKKCRI